MKEHLSDSDKPDFEVVHQNKKSVAHYTSYKNILEKYPFAILIPRPQYDEIQNWLDKNFDNHSYIRFGNIYCFESDEDKILFGLRWS